MSSGDFVAALENTTATAAYPVALGGWISAAADT